MRKRRLTGRQIPPDAPAPSIRLALWPVATFVVAVCLGATQDANEPGLPCPAQNFDVMPKLSVLAFAKSIAQAPGGFRRQLARLSTDCPLPRYGV